MSAVYLTVQQVADLAQVAEKTVRRAIAAGRLRAHRPGGANVIRIAEMDAQAWIEDSPAGAAVHTLRVRRPSAGRRRAEKGSYADLMASDRKAAS